jgi:tetratricopeptide (TPR) repeat protein
MFAYAAAYWALALAPKVDVNVDVEDGAVLSGERRFRITVQPSKPNDIVNQVEFYVGTDLRDSDSSTPYEFRLDTLGESEGPLQLRFKAFTSEGDSGEKVVNVRIDNGMSKGEPFHLEAGQASYSDGKYQEALVSGRIAFKINPNSVRARILLARTNLALNVFDAAQKFAEDALSADPANTEAADIVASVNLRRAFNTINRDSDRVATLGTIRNAFKLAVEARRSTLDRAVDSFASVTDSNVIDYADAVLRAQRYSLAINELSGRFDRENSRVDLANRLAFAHLQSGKYAEALKVLTTLKRYGKPDAYSFALLAVVQAQIGDIASSDESVKEAILIDNGDSGVLTAQAFLALKQSRTSALAGFANRLASERAQRPETWFYVAAVNNRIRRFSEGRRGFERSVLAEPTLTAAYVERALESMTIATQGEMPEADKNYLFDTARAFFETASIARPDSAHALAGVALVALYKKNISEAISYGEAAVKASPTNPVGHYAVSAAYAYQASALSKAAGGRLSPDVTRYNGLAATSNRAAGTFDPKYLQGRPVPKEADILKYMTEAGRIPVISLPASR